MRKRILFMVVLYFCAAALPLYTVARFYSHTESAPENPEVITSSEKDISLKDDTFNAHLIFLTLPRVI